MAKQNLVIIDTGCANLASVRMAFERLGVQPRVSREAADIEQADKLILPGVGTAVAAMKNLNERGWCRSFAPPSSRCWFLPRHADAGGGVRREHGGRWQDPCLDRLSWHSTGQDQADGGGQPAPAHMGWNQIEHDETHPLLKGIPSGSYFYFVHSYALEVTEATLATCDYGKPFTAIVGGVAEHSNFFGAQFHPGAPAWPEPAYCKLLEL